MTVARKKSAPTARITEWKPWDEAYAKVFQPREGWTIPSRVKVVSGRTAGTLTATFGDRDGDPVDGYILFRLKAGKWSPYEYGFRLVKRFTISAGAK